MSCSSTKHTSLYAVNCQTFYMSHWLKDEEQQWKSLFFSFALFSLTKTYGHLFHRLSIYQIQCVCIMDLSCFHTFRCLNCRQKCGSSTSIKLEHLINNKNKSVRRHVFVIGYLKSKTNLFCGPGSVYIYTVVWTASLTKTNMEYINSEYNIYINIFHRDGLIYRVKCE